MKFGRTYQCSITGFTKTWAFGMPFTCKLSVASTGTPSANKAHFVFYNLPEEMRNDIVKDYADDPTYRGITFAAGYKDDAQLPIIFIGNVFFAFTYRRGTDWLTEIDCFDGGFAMKEGVIDETFSKDATELQIQRSIIAAMPHVTAGYISKRLVGPERSRAVTVSGNAWEALVQRVLPLDGEVFISNGRVHILAPDEHLPPESGLSVISPDSGMIGSPRRQGPVTIVTMLFEPRVLVGQVMELQSFQDSGPNRVWTMQHQGIISPTVGGELTTTVVFIRSPASVEVAA